MSPSKSKNTITGILQKYAVVNAGCGVILFFYLASNMTMSIAFAALVAVFLASLLLYGFGEIIELLEEIKSNTSKDTDTAATDELPEL